MISGPSAVTASATSTAILCHGGSSTVTVTASGGTGSYQGTGTFTQPAGSYSFTVSDGNNCTSTATLTISEPSAVTASATSTAILCHGGCSTVMVTAAGGPGSYQGTGTFTQPAGSYSFTVSDGNNCTSTATLTI